MTVGEIVREPLLVHARGNKAEQIEMVRQLLETVGLTGEMLNRYPHEFSGGQRQRVSIARALALNPKLLIADEPVSALDVSVRSQVLNLMVKLQRERNLTYIFISHDLSVVEHISDSIAIMYLGRIMEKGPADRVFARPLHPYTRALLEAIPVPDPAERAVRMSMAMREAAGALIAEWRERGRDLGFGAGIAQGYATLGQIGFSERSGYTAIGTVCNVAARLCAEAKDGQILLSQRVNVALKGSVVTEQVGALALKGLTQPVVAYNVPLAATQPALRVIDGRSPSV